jgi:threonine/homoserine/homoserine lactone efflux protein
VSPASIDLIAFLAVAAVVIATPGPDTALTIRNTLVGGRRGGLFTALGVAVGQAIWTVAASAGVAALIVASEPAFAAVKLAGAAYLVFLGLQGLWRAFGPGEGAPETPWPRPRAASAGGAFRQGVVSNLANPKMAVFFTSLLPQFVPEGQASLGALLALGLLFCALTLAWLSAYGVAIARARAALARPRLRRAIEGLSGAALVACGARLAAQHR